jgi:hypothetical protein
MFYEVCKKIIILLFLNIVFVSSQVTKLSAEYFQQRDSVLNRVFKQSDRYRLQIMLSYFSGESWKHEFFGDSMKYFYPASLVKFPTVLAVIALLEEQKIPFHEWKNLFIRRKKEEYQTFYPMKMIIMFDSIEKHVSVKDHIVRSLLVSDNYSFDFLFELCGYNKIQEVLKEYNASQSRVVHHFGSYKKIHDTLVFPETGIYTRDENLLYSIRCRYKVPEIIQREGTKTGKIKNSLCKDKDFSRSNLIHLPDIHRMMFTFLNKTKKDFFLSDNSRNLINECLLRSPNQIVFYGYDSVIHYPALKKYLLYGSDKNAMLSDTIQIRNIVGQSYGFLADVAEIRTRSLPYPFYLSVVIYTNDKNCFGKGKYEYQETGFPFLKNLGRIAISYVYQKTYR